MGSTPLPGKDEKRRNGKNKSGKDRYGAKKPKSIGQHEILKCVPTVLQDLFALFTENTYEGIERTARTANNERTQRPKYRSFLPDISTVLSQPGLKLLLG